MADQARGEAGPHETLTVRDTSELTGICVILSAAAAASPLPVMSYLPNVHIPLSLFYLSERPYVTLAL